jgi:hypothetical protein
MHHNSHRFVPSFQGGNDQSRPLAVKSVDFIRERRLWDLFMMKNQGVRIIVVSISFFKSQIGFSF